MLALLHVFMGWLGVVIGLVVECLVLVACVIVWWAMALHIKLIDERDGVSETWACYTQWYIVH